MFNGWPSAPFSLWRFFLLQSLSLFLKKKNPPKTHNQSGDTNKDGYLDDDELRAFQQHAFQMDVSDEELEHVKQLVRYDNRDAVVNGKMTVEGFLALMMRFFEKAQFQTIWEVLRQYGYMNDLRL